VLRNGEHIPLCRLRYGGSAHSFGFAIYSAAHDRYQDATLRTGLPERTTLTAPPMTRRRDVLGGGTGHCVADIDGRQVRVPAVGCAPFMITSP
jgi:hypothetical protein